MCFQTIYHSVSISKDQLFKLLLDQGDLPINLYKQKPISIKRFSDQRGVRVELSGVTIYEAKIRGTTEDQNLSYIDGMVTITPIIDGSVFMCFFELRLHDHCS